jgi:hypothetical protein
MRVASNSRGAGNSKDSKDVSSRGVHRVHVDNGSRDDKNIKHNSDRDACNIMNSVNSRWTLSAAIM